MSQPTHVRRDIKFIKERILNPRKCLLLFSLPMICALFARVSAAAEVYCTFVIHSSDGEFITLEFRGFFRWSSWPTPPAAAAAIWSFVTSDSYSNKQNEIRSNTCSKREHFPSA
jgi:hypothetical protein